VLAAQRALVKLGYTQVKADGVPGEATRSAIERFERERKLPVTGRLNPVTVRELAAASGMKLD
jgi:peptidoglycan hydrolase-like protein with peptidoglycan-binding domain